MNRIVLLHVVLCVCSTSSEAESPGPTAGEAGVEGKEPAGGATEAVSMATSSMAVDSSTAAGSAESPSQ